MKYMVFLNWIDDVLERAFDIIGGFFNVIWSFLCSIIYGLITLMFNIFTKLTQMDILDAGNININGISKNDNDHNNYHDFLYNF